MMPQRLKAAWSPAATRIDAMTLRERAIIFVTLLAGLFLFANSFLFTKLVNERTQLERGNQARLTEIKAVNAQIVRIGEDANRDPDEINRRRIGELRGRLEQAEIAAKDITRGLVSPREMARLMQDMLARHGGLELVHLENLTPEPLTPAPAATNDKKAPAVEPAGQGLYRHGLRVTLRGRYIDVVRYLRAVEALSWKVLWSEVKLETEEYPVSRVTITIYTLSIDKTWIGV
jgi:MSHA biogenesis protein MshJ